MGEAPKFVGHVLHVGAATFSCSYPDLGIEDGQLPVIKPPELVERCIRLSEELQPRRMVELGISKGGSTAMWAALIEPDKLVALELAPTPVALLTDFIEHHQLQEQVRPYYGVDQGDRDRLAEIVDDEFGDQPVDLVFDDASHRYDETLASFEVLFPRLRPGGLYVIEDWAHEHWWTDVLAARLAADPEGSTKELEAWLTAHPEHDRHRRPMARLAVELTVARASNQDSIRSVACERDWIVVVKGDEVLEPSTFRLSDLVHDHDGFLR
jgi:predicted O-methyltransferase YrrM